MTSRILFSVTLVLLSNSAYAYLDPGTGSILIQGLIAGIVGGLYTIKLYWQRLKDFFTSFKNKNGDSTTFAENNTDALNSVSQTNDSSASSKEI